MPEDLNLNPVKTSNLNALAILAGKKFVRPETGFIHYTYHAAPTEPHVTIPMYENFLWALANFQLKTQEGIQEGRRLLLKLLHFQNNKGEFPVYVHEYPEAGDRFLGAYLFQPLFYILRDFSTVMGSDLKSLLHRSLMQLVEVLKYRYEELKPTGHIKLKIAAVLWAFEQRDELLHESFEQGPVSSSYLADLELAKDMKAPHLPSWPAFYWHEDLQVYCGPAYKERHEGSLPETTLFDLMMGKDKKDGLTPHHLAAALVKNKPKPAQLQERGVKQGKNWAYAALEQAKTCDTALEVPLYFQPGFHLFRFLTRGEKGIDSFAIPGGRFGKVTFQEYEKGIRFEFTYPTEFETESKDKCRELELFFSMEGKVKGSTFRFDEPVEIKFKEVSLTCTFKQVLGTGDFIGQRSHGNRPAQLVKTAAYDEVLSLRTLRRSPETIIELEIEISDTGESA